MRLDGCLPRASTSAPTRCSATIAGESRIISSTSSSPTDIYTAARYAADAADAIREILARGRVPLVVGGTGFYYRALTRGLFPGPGARRGAAGAPRTHRRSARRRLSPPHGAAGRSRVRRSASSPRDRKRLVRALEVYLLTGRPLTAHFAETVSPLALLRCRADRTADSGCAHLGARDAARRRAVRRGLMDEIRGLLARGVPETARPFGGLVYRQALELLHGVRDEAATRALIVQENRRYARRQLIWFRKEPNLVWLDGPGESGGCRRARRTGTDSAPGATRLMPHTPDTRTHLAQPNIQDVVPQLRAARAARRHDPADGRAASSKGGSELRSLRAHRRAGRHRPDAVQARDRDASGAPRVGRQLLVLAGLNARTAPPA